jgi:hypothetical protein
LGRVGVPDTAGDTAKVHLIPTPLILDNVPLTSALDRIGISVDEGGFVLFGVEVIAEDGQEPFVSARIPAGSTLSDALTQVIQSVPDYTFTAITPHLVNVLPRESASGPGDLMNLQIPKVELRNVSPSNFLSNPSRFIPELKAALSHGSHAGCEIGPGLSDKAPGITLSLANSTLRQAMNRVSEVTISSAERSEGSAFGWVYQHERFPSATRPAEMWRVQGVWQPPNRKEPR